MPFWTLAGVGVQLRVIANESESNPSPRVRRGPTITKQRRPGPAPAEPQVSGRCTPPPTKGRVNGAPARNCIIRHGSPRDWPVRATVVDGTARRERFEPEPSGQDRRPVPDCLRHRVPSGNLGLLRRFLIGRLPEYRNVSEQLPGVSDDLLMTCRIPPGDLFSRLANRVKSP